MNTKEENLEIAKNQDLNEEAEYTGNKQDLEQMLLEAQRYLNIFHQIHIFNKNKREEFDQSLINIPDKLRAVLLNLPGGRILIEHIEECEIKKGLRVSRSIFSNDDPFIKTQKELEKTSAVNKEFTTAITNTIADTMSTYNQNLLQMNEKIMQNSKQLSGDGKGFTSPAKLIADALKESNQQQAEMMKNFGTTLFQAILMSQKEIFASASKMIETNPIFDASLKKNTNIDISQAKQEINPSSVSVSSPAVASVSTTPANSQPNIKNNQNTTQVKESKNGTDNTKNNTNKNTTVQPAVKPINSQTVQNNNSKKTDNNAQKNVKITDEKQIQNTKTDAFQNAFETTKSKEEKLSKNADAKKDELSDIDIMNLLTSADKKEEEQPTNDKISKFSEAMQKIKSAITDPADKLLSEIDDTPISLNADDDDLTTSFTKAYENKSSKVSKVQSSQKSDETEEKWEYVDEDGNPIDPNEWEYVDEDGNPIDPNEWEYVDEDGNPIDLSELGYINNKDKQTSK